MNKRSTPADFAGKQRTGARCRAPGAEGVSGIPRFGASGIRTVGRRFAPGAEGVSGSSIRRGGAV